jgi:signal transduction histidine kinase
MMTNLLDNALKYGPEGQTVTVGAKVVGNHVHIRVDDEGPGIGRSDRSRVFEPYRRLDRDVEGQVRGSGLGLAVVAELAERYEGRARVVDSPSGGARFIVELPGGVRTNTAVPEPVRA